jgi:16S rRNA (cytosine1402-N4)-methyltransferase
MVSEVLEHLNPSRGGVFVDCTVGLGGHARAILEAGATRLIGLDRDPAALATARTTLSAFGDRVELVHSDYRRLGAVLDARGLAGVDGIVADLGTSSMQLDTAGRGFSFRRDEPLDMRMDTTVGPTAAEAIASVDERTLADVIHEFGEERYARRIAHAMVERRQHAPIDTTGQLADVVRRAIPRKGFSKIDPATRTFQAIRIWVNRELEGLDAFIIDAARRLNAGGRLVIIAFHSLEDRVVKHTLRALAGRATVPTGAAGAGVVGLAIRTKRPLVPSEAEIAANPRARSAKLRAAERTHL